MSLKTPVGIAILAGASSAALVAAVVVVFSTPAVQADARLSRPPATEPPTLPVEAPTPASLAAHKPASSTALALNLDALRGVASWYGKVLDGHRTASGERFNMYALTACHPTLPFGTLVKVTDTTNKKSVIVRINDRGVLSNGRVIDLSYAAAEQLNFTHAGLASVKLEVVKMGRLRRYH